jgi:acid phosphatase class B
MKQIRLKWKHEPDCVAQLFEAGASDYVASVCYVNCDAQWYVHDEPDFSNGMSPTARWGESQSFSVALVTASREVARQLIIQHAIRGDRITVEIRRDGKILEVVM